MASSAKPMMPTSRPALPTKRIAACAIACALAGAACKQDTNAPPDTNEPQDTRPRTIVLITIDGLVPGRLALFGGAEAWPSLERLARGGKAWGDAWTAAPMTRPAVATYLTGLAPDRHGVRDDRFSRLDGSIATLAERLSATGYSTAAFPDSSFLGSSSGVLRGFEAAAEPLSPPLGPAGWHPAPRAPDEVVTDFRAWFEALPAQARSFAWLHFSGPLFQQLRDAFAERAGGPGEDAAPSETAETPLLSPIERLDAALGQVEQLLASRGELDSALILVAGTQGSARGGEGWPAGLGYSLDEPALRVFIVAQWPGATGSWDAARVAWSPDVPATIAAAAGVSLADGAEGLSLLETAPADRVCFAWTWATVDQMGWRAQRAARSGGVKRIEGLTTTTTRVDAGDEAVPSEVEARLAAALSERAEPAARSVPLDLIRPVLEAHGLTLRPVPSEGRDFGDEASRSEVGERVLLARHAAVRGDGNKSREQLAAALGLDADNPGVRLDLGQILAGVNPGRSRQLLSGAVERYPTDPELLHWYAHAVWQESWRDAEALLELIEPYKGREADVLYDLACTRSLGEDLDASEAYLRRAIDAGFVDFPHIETDPDLRNLRQSGRLSEVLREHR